jgi:hypothetical protein
MPKIDVGNPRARTPNKDSNDLKIYFNNCGLFLFLANRQKYSELIFSTLTPMCVCIALVGFEPRSSAQKRNGRVLNAK